MEISISRPSFWLFQGIEWRKWEKYYSCVKILSFIIMPCFVLQKPVLIPAQREKTEFTQPVFLLHCYAQQNRWPAGKEKRPAGLSPRRRKESGAIHQGRKSAHMRRREERGILVHVPPPGDYQEERCSSHVGYKECSMQQPETRQCLCFVFPTDKVQNS